MSKLRFELNGVRLSTYPYLITLYVEPRLHSQGHTGGKPLSLSSSRSVSVE